MNKITNYVNEIFEGLKRSLETENQKDELIENLSDRVNDLMNTGMSLDDAMNKVINDFGDVYTVRKELGLNYLNATKKSIHPSRFIILFGTFVVFIFALISINSSGIILHANEKPRMLNTEYNIYENWLDIDVTLIDEDNSLLKMDAILYKDNDKVGSIELRKENMSYQMDSNYQEFSGGFNLKYNADYTVELKMTYKWGLFIKLQDTIERKDFKTLEAKMPNFSFNNITTGIDYIEINVNKNDNDGVLTDAYAVLCLNNIQLPDSRMDLTHKSNLIYYDKLYYGTSYEIKIYGKVDTEQVNIENDDYILFETISSQTRTTAPEVTIKNMNIQRNFVAFDVDVSDNYNQINTVKVVLSSNNQIIDEIVLDNGLNQDVKFTNLLLGKTYEVYTVTNYQVKNYTQQSKELIENMKYIQTYSVIQGTEIYFFKNNVGSDFINFELNIHDYHDILHHVKVKIYKDQELVALKVLDVDLYKDLTFNNLNANSTYVIDVIRCYYDGGTYKELSTQAIIFTTSN